MVQLVPEPLPALSTSSQNEELDVTQEEIAIPGSEIAQWDAEPEAGRPEETSTNGEDKQMHMMPNYCTFRF